MTLFTNLISWFGIIGIASIVCWLGALALAAVSLLRFSRGVWATAALVLAIGGCWLADANMEAVYQIQIDPREQLAAAQKKRAAELAKMSAQRESEVADVRFAEDSEINRLDLAGVEENDDIYAHAKMDAEEKVPAYKKRGKTGSLGSEATLGTGNRRGLLPGEEPPAPGLIKTDDDVISEAPPARMLPRDEVNAAQAYAGANEGIASVVYWLALLLLIGEYLRYFNSEPGSILPLPFASGYADWFSQKDYIWREETADRAVVSDLVARVVRRGEPFVLLGSPGLIAETSLARLPFGFLPQQLVVVDETDLDDDFIFHSLWFGRHVFVIEDVARAKRFIGSLWEQLETHRATRATTFRTVNLIWALDDGMPENWCAEMGAFAARANWRLVLPLSDGVRRARPTAAPVAPMRPGVGLPRQQSTTMTKSPAPTSAAAQKEQASPVVDGPFVVTCAACLKKLKVKASLAGKKIRCPKCKEVIACIPPESSPRPLQTSKTAPASQQQTKPAATTTAPKSKPTPGTFKTRCPACRKKLRLKDKMHGKTIRCPGCKKAYEATTIE